MGCVNFLVVAPLVAITRGQAFIAVKFGQSRAKAQGGVAAECTQALAFVQSVRAMGAEVLQQQRFAECNGAVRSIMLLEHLLVISLMSLKQYVLAATMGTFVWYFSMRVMAGSTQLGTAYSFMMVRL